MSLKFDINGITTEILNKLQKEIADAFIAWENEVKGKIKGDFFGKGTRPYVASYLKREGRMLIGFLEANTYVLADSYGTGSLMLDNNPGLAEYKASKYWNPARRGKAIAGRPAGEYTTLFGNKRHSSGAFKGKNIENLGFLTKRKGRETEYHISPSHPSYALQMAEQWLYKTYLPRAYQNAIKQINFGKYLIES